MLILSPLTFLLYGIIKLVLTILGLILIPIAILFKAYHKRPSLFPENGNILLFSWPFMHLYNDYEAGITAGIEFPNAPLWWKIFYWTAIRNPANGLRFVSWLNPKPEPYNVKFISSFGTNKSSLTYDELRDKEEHGNFWYFCWYKSWANLRIQFFVSKTKQLRIWIGTKIYPSNKYKIPSYQRYGAATTFQIKILSKKDF